MRLRFMASRSRSAFAPRVPGRTPLARRLRSPERTEREGQAAGAASSAVGHITHLAARRVVLEHRGGCSHSQVVTLAKQIPPSCHTPPSSWMWPNRWSFGRTSRTRARRSSQPCRPPTLDASPKPRGGPCVIRTSVPPGISAHLSARGAPRGRLNAQSLNAGCHGLPQNRTPSIVAPSSCKYVTPTPSRAHAASRSFTKHQSWFPATTTLCRCGSPRIHSATGASDLSDPLRVRSPACTNTSPSGTVRSSSNVCVSATATIRILASSHPPPAHAPGSPPRAPYTPPSPRPSGGMADAPDSKSGVREDVPVRVRPRLPGR